LWDGQALDAEGFEVDFAVGDAAAEGLSSPPLDQLHDDDGQGDDGEEDAEDDDEEDPEGGVCEGWFCGGN
jgi:hypothetical protein